MQVKPNMRETQSAASAARRLLAGAGSATALFYEYPTASKLDNFAHGLTSDGELVIVTCKPDTRFLPNNSASTSADHATNELDSAETYRIRFEISRDAPRFDVKILTASLHLLGDLCWVAPAEVARLLSNDKLPENLRVLLGVPGARLATIHFQQAVLHDPNGITPLSRVEIISASTSQFPSSAQELDCYALVGAQPNNVLSRVCRAVVAGQAPGKVCSKCPLKLAHASLANRVFCADIDSSGVTLMYVGIGEMTTVYAQFSEPVKNISQFSAQLSQLG